MKNAVLIITLLTIAIGCKNYYVAPDFKAKTEKHTTVAILPFEIINTGKQPANLTDAQLAELEDGERQAFQISLYNEILRSTKAGKKPITVNVQNFSITNDLLKQSGITLKQASTENPIKMADILGVDAVIKTRVQKTRYMSDLASFGISLGQDILSNIPGASTVSDALPYDLNKSNDVDASCSIINVKDQTTLYSYGTQMEIDYNTSSAEAIMYINRRISKTFPYRKEN